MKTFEQFNRTNILAEKIHGTFSDNHGTDLGKLYQAIANVEKTVLEVRKYSKSLQKDLSSYDADGNSRLKMDKLLQMAEDPSEIMKNSKLILQRLQEQSTKLEKK